MHVNLTARNDTGRLNTSPVTTMTPVVRLKSGCNHTITIPGMPVVLLISCLFTFLPVCPDVCPEQFFQQQQLKPFLAGVDARTVDFFDYLSGFVEQKCQVASEVNKSTMYKASFFRR